MATNLKIQVSNHIEGWTTCIREEGIVPIYITEFWTPITLLSQKVVRERSEFDGNQSTGLIYMYNRLIRVLCTRDSCYIHYQCFFM